MRLASLQKIVPYLILMLAGTLDSQSQDSVDPIKEAVYPSYLVFTELGGPGLYSANVEKYISRTVGIRVGYGVAVPAFVNLYFGYERQLELGAGLVYAVYEWPELYGEKRTLLGLTIGHKYQPYVGGFTLRYTFAPMLNLSDGKFIPMFGLSAGIAFP